MKIEPIERERYETLFSFTDEYYIRKLKEEYADGTVYAVYDDACVGWCHLDIPDQIAVSGDITLVLEDGCELNALRGLRINENSSLTIYAQSEANAGALEAFSRYSAPSPT